MFAAPTLTGRAAFVPRAPIRAQRLRNRTMAVATAEETTTKAAEPAADSEPKFYVGKGKYVAGSSELDRSVLSQTGREGILTGGFAGGEVGLKAYVAELGPDAKNVKKEYKSETEASPKNKAKNALYVGKGRYLPNKPEDNSSRVIASTGRDSTLVGGFAAGEVGLRKYVETGEVPFAPEGSRRRQQSPLIVAGILSASAVTGGILLNDLGEVGEQVVGGAGVRPTVLAGLDENTKLLLETAVLLLGVLATVVGGRALVGNLTNGIKDGAARLATLAVFWVAVFVAARFILDS